MSIGHTVYYYQPAALKQSSVFVNCNEFFVQFFWKKGQVKQVW